MSTERLAAIPDSNSIVDVQVEPTCPLFARKFPLDTAKNVLRTVAGCDSQLGLTSPHSCINPAEISFDHISPMEQVVQGVLNAKSAPTSLRDKFRLSWLQPQQQLQLPEQSESMLQGQVQQILPHQPQTLLKALQRQKQQS